MTALVVVAGIIAAFILFRPARYLAMVALLIVVVYFIHGCATYQATQSPPGHLG